MNNKAPPKKTLVCSCRDAVGVSPHTRTHAPFYTTRAAQTHPFTHQVLPEGPKSGPGFRLVQEDEEAKGDGVEAEEGLGLLFLWCGLVSCGGCVRVGGAGAGDV